MKISIFLSMLLCTAPLVSKNSDTVTARKHLLGSLFAHIASYFLGDVRAASAQHPYSALQAQVRTGYDIAEEEKKYVQERLPKVQHALEALLSTTLSSEKVPTIAFCGSGGGYRAMVTMLGALQGAEEIGLLDASVYAAGVSGSAWALAVLTQLGLPVAACLEQVTESIATDLLDGYNHRQVTAALLKQIAFTQQFSLVDFYGALLAQKLLCASAVADVDDISLASQAEKVATAEHLCPIYSAVIDAGDNRYEWVEFTPYEVSSMFLGASIPTWAFGRSFKAGVSTDFDPAQSLGFGMGIWGSSFTANAKDVVRYLEDTDSSLVSHLFSLLVDSLPDVITQKRFVSPAHVRNWSYATALHFARRKNLHILDAGFAFNLPFLPLVRKARPVDIMIIIDASPEADAGELRNAEAFARTHNIAFPPIDYSKVTLPCSVHAQWSDPHVPVIIYCPLVAQNGYAQGWDPHQEDFTSTFNFKYTPEQTKLLSGLATYSLKESQELLVDTIKKVIEQK